MLSLTFAFSVWQDTQSAAAQAPAAMLKNANKRILPCFIGPPRRRLLCESRDRKGPWDPSPLRPEDRDRWRNRSGLSAHRRSYDLHRGNGSNPESRYAQGYWGAYPT